MSGVTIVIPTWNGLQLLKEFLPSVLRAADNYCRADREPAEILIVDDGSTDDTSEWLESQGFHELEAQAAEPSAPSAYSGSLCARQLHSAGPLESSSCASAASIEESESADERNPIYLSFVKSPVNRGFSSACNTGFAAARHPFVFLLNNDVEPAPDSISLLRSNFNEPSVFAVHCRVFNSETNEEIGTGKLCSFSRGFLRVHRSYISRPEAGTGTGPALRLYSAFAGGGASMFDREKFIEIGTFDDLFSPFYWEDVELSYRAWKRGYTVLYEPRAGARHRISSTIGKLPKSHVKRVQQRNRMLLHWIHLHDSRMMIWHITWLLILTLTAPLRLQPGFVASVASALARIRDVRKRRSLEKLVGRRTDRAVISIFNQLLVDPRIIAYDGISKLPPEPSRDT